MLHSGLPRAYLASPGMGYLAGYFGAEERAYAYAPARHLEEAAAYAQSRLLGAPWDALAEPRRAPSPCPLDLSLKPPPTPGSSRVSAEDCCDPIEVDDEEDRRSREEARSQHSSCYGPRDPDEDIIVDDTDSQRSCSSEHSYQPLPLPPPPPPPPPPPTLLAYEAHQLHQRKLLLGPAAYQQQLLLTPTQQPQPHLQGISAPMTPPSTPSPPQCPRRRHREDEAASVTPRPVAPAAEGKPRAKKKHARRLKFDEDTSSPVSGTVILGPDEAVVTGDIDPAFNIVEVTEEARAELAKIENRLGPYQCKLCRQLHEDAFQLAQHRCSRIAHVEYRCPECDKRFSCPANLASHRRWHKPRPTVAAAPAPADAAPGEQLACTRCDAKFARQAALRKHVASQHAAEQNNNSSNNNNNNDSSSDNNNHLQLEGCKQQLGVAAAAMEIA